MRQVTSACVLLVCVLAVRADAQAPAPASPDAPRGVPPPAWAYNDFACAPSLLTIKRTPKDAPVLRVVGVQDTASKDLLAPPDVLVISGGSGAGLQTGQQYFVRRIIGDLTNHRSVPTVHTAGWVQILGVDASVATATILHACEGILIDDYLEPFTPPLIAASPAAGSVPQYENMGHIVTGPDGVEMAATGRTITIDRGSNGGVVLGQRFLVFRDKRELQMQRVSASPALAAMSGRTPLVEVGEIVVIAVRPEDATAQVTMAKDAIMKGDLIAPMR